MKLSTSCQDFKLANSACVLYRKEELRLVFPSPLYLPFVRLLSEKIYALL